MGFLERARSTRGRHQRTRSTKIDEPVPEGAPPQFKSSGKRKSIFPGLSSNTNEVTRPRASSARASFSKTTATSMATPRDEQILPPNVSHFASSQTFKCPSPALVNKNVKRTPPSSVAHLPSMPKDAASPFTPAPKSSAKAPPPPTWNRAVTDPVLSTMQRETLPKQANTWEQPPDNSQRPQLKKQKSAWKSFGDLFRGKQAKQPDPNSFYQVQPPSSDALVHSNNATRSRMGVLESPLPSPAGNNERTVARVDSGCDELAPPTEKGQNSFPVRTSSRNPSQNWEAASDATSDARRTPRLDINIPEAGFDRYSVMFEKLLEPKKSLLERRQSKRVSCQNSGSSVNAPETVQSSSGLQRSLTSPSLNRMPSLTIHIANSNYAVRSSTAQNQYKGPMAHRPRPPKRSMTAPSAAKSPLAIPQERSTPKTAIAIPLPESTTTGSSPRYSILSENSLPPTPNTAVSLASSINTTIFGSPMSTPPKATRASIANQMATMPQQPSNSPPPIPSRSEERRPSQIRNYPAGSERFNRQIVQVSVARQVSVSKARRRVADAVEVKQPLRPRVVDLGKNRKSTLVMIEGGDS